MPMTQRSEQVILVVDDSEANRYAVARGLRAEGFGTIEAANGTQALAMAGDASAVVLDVNLPDIHGHDVCRRLRGASATAGLPIVHVSAVYITGYHRALGERAGANEYMVSPIDPQALASTLDRLIAQRPAR